jgi:hypothetical protein
MLGLEVVEWPGGDPQKIEETVDIVGRIYFEGVVCYGYELRNPIRFKKRCPAHASSAAVLALSVFRGRRRVKPRLKPAGKRVFH